MSVVITTFEAEDVYEFFSVSGQEAERFLVINKHLIEQQMIEAGWKAIEELGDLDGLRRLPKEEEK